MPFSVDIVLPCYNPNDRWHLELINFHAAAKEQYFLNYVLVDDGSSAGSLTGQIDELAKRGIPIHFISYRKNKGKGFALRKGVAESKSQYCLYTDIDFPFTDQSTLCLMQALVTAQYDVVVGYREQAYYGNKMSAFRRGLSKAFRYFLSNILKMPITDTQCGLKGFNEKGKEKFLATRTDRYLFDFEFIYSVCKSSAFRIHSIPVQLKDNVVFSKMKLSVLFQETANLLSILIFRK